MVNDKIAFCESHIKKLEEKLEKIYTVELLHISPIESVENVDVRKELEKRKFAINIYAKLERGGIKKGETFEQYNTYLTNSRYGAAQAEEVIKQIEEENVPEIKNIKTLLESFKLELKSLK